LRDNPILRDDCAITIAVEFREIARCLRRRIHEPTGSEHDAERACIRTRWNTRIGTVVTVCRADYRVSPRLFHQFVSHHPQSRQSQVRVSPERLGDRPPHASIHLVSIHISVNQRRILLVNVLIPISRHNGSNVPVLLNQNRVEFLQSRSEEHTSELQSRFDLVCRLLLEKKNYKQFNHWSYNRYISINEMRMNDELIPRQHENLDWSH